MIRNPPKGSMDGKRSKEMMKTPTPKAASKGAMGSKGKMPGEKLNGGELNMEDDSTHHNMSKNKMDKMKMKKQIMSAMEKEDTYIN